jgi:hypothetical protein
VSRAGRLLGDLDSSPRWQLGGSGESALAPQFHGGLAPAVLRLTGLLDLAGGDLHDVDGVPDGMGGALVTLGGFCHILTAKHTTELKEDTPVSQQKPKDTIWSKYGFLWGTLALFIVSLAGHWIFAWYAFVAEQAQHGQTPETAEFIIQTTRDTLENWQSEFLQLCWQVSGLALLYHVGSPQSKDGNDRLEEKVDLILKAVAKDGDKDISRLDRAYHRD